MSKSDRWLGQAKVCGGDWEVPGQPPEDTPCCGRGAGSQKPTSVGGRCVGRVPTMQRSSWATGVDISRSEEGGIGAVALGPSCDH